MPLKRILTLVFYAIVLIISAVGFAKIFLSPGFSGTLEEMAFDKDILFGTTMLINLSLVLILVILIAAFAASPIIGIITNPKGFVRSLIGVGVLVVIFIIGYSTADGVLIRGYETMGIDTPEKSKLIGGVINTVFILIVVAIVAYIYSSITSLLKQL